MLVTYTLQIADFELTLKSLPPEIEKTDMVIVFKIHNVEMELTNDDIARKTEITFILNVLSVALVPEHATMNISAYKYHPTGIKILIGSIDINIKIFVDLALMLLGDVVAIPGYYALKNPTGVNGGILTSLIQLMIVDERLQGYSEYELFQPEPPQNPTTGNDGRPGSGTAAGGVVSQLGAFYYM